MIKQEQIQEQPEKTHQSEICMNWIIYTYRDLLFFGYPYKNSRFLVVNRLFDSLLTVF